MRQLFQNLKTGKIDIQEIPYPEKKEGHYIIQSRASLISPGTEGMLLEFGQAGLINKARQQPDKVRQVMDKLRTDGLIPTVQAVRTKLDQPLPLGYCNVGTIIDQPKTDGQDVGLAVGDRVISNGPHAEVVRVPKNLCVKVPDSVSDDEAVFAVMGSIGLQGIRLAQPTLGEYFVVYGLGLIGLLTVQILQANGCRVLGVDIASTRCELAQQLGAETVDLSRDEDALEKVFSSTRGTGADGVIITAATKSIEPVSQSAQMARKRGRIVLVGTAGLKLSRTDFYEKELSFQVSCSYGPGRYDTQYEIKGYDYPIGYVRWTEQRNFEAVLDLMAAGKFNTDLLVSHKLPFEDSIKAYNIISEKKEPYMGIILHYGEYVDAEAGLHSNGIKNKTVYLEDGKESSHVTNSESLNAGFIGAGNFSGNVLLPALKNTAAGLKVIVSSGGVSGTHVGKRYGFEESTTDVERIFADPEINTVFITTHHDTHASFVRRALEADKNVFVEKPLCLNLNELSEIESIYNSKVKTRNSRTPLLMVGFNRRFAPHIIKIKSLLSAIKEPKSFIVTVNAGALPKNHWTQDPKIGGGRIIGEACHFIDLLRFLAGNKIIDHSISRLKTDFGDTATIQLSFSDGSIGTIHYFANGNRKFPKERLDVFCQGRILQLDNFRILHGWGWKGFKKMKLWRQDKGHDNEMQAFVNAVINARQSPIPFDEIIEVTKVTLDLNSMMD